MNAIKFLSVHVLLPLAWSMTFEREGLRLHVNDESSKALMSMELKAGLDGIQRVNMGVGMAGYGMPDTVTDTDESLLVKWRDDLSLRLRPQADNPCVEIYWEAPCQMLDLQDCYDLDGAHWYGGTSINQNTYPVETWDQPMEAFVTGDTMSKTKLHQYSGVQDRYWLNSNGTNVYVDRNTPLWVSINDNSDGQICFLSSFSVDNHYFPYYNWAQSQLVLNYTVCTFNDMMTAHETMTPMYWSNPKNKPADDLFRYPIWSTWARYKKEINQSIVLDFAKEIKSYGFPAAQFEIDDGWYTEYGALEFNTTRFPDPAGMFANLTAMGYTNTLWVNPFVNMYPDYNFWSYNQAEYVWTRGWSQNQPVPGLTFWWDGFGSIVDFTSTTARIFFKAELRSLRNLYNIAAFKYDAGESVWLPPSAQLREEEINPNAYTKAYVETIADFEETPYRYEVRVGAYTQQYGGMVRMLDKASDWDFKNGLQTIIPIAITYGLIGYPFILPDIVAGNDYGLFMPSRELFIRWVELNTLMPFIQFSISPWQYDAEVVNITHTMLDLHESFYDTFQQLADDAITTGSPIIRPLWWIAPHDQEAMVVDNEFLVGDTILVAPVVEEGALSRDIYLPLGEWKDELRGGVHNGPVWLTDYAVALDELAYFINLASPAKSN